MSNTFEGDPQSWSNAMNHVAAMGFIPTSFSTAIRLLMVDEKQGLVTTSPVSNFLMGRVLQSPTIKASFYYATLTYYGTEVNNTPYLSSAQLLRFFPPGEIAGILLNIFYFRRIKNFCKISTNDPVFKNFLLDIELGRLVGEAIPKIGTLKGLLIGSLKFYSMAIFKFLDTEKFNTYMIHLKSTNQHYDNEMELQFWGCTHQQIGSQILQSLSFGLPLVHCYNLAFCKNDDRTYDTDPDSFSLAIAERWVNTLRETGKIPDFTHDGRLYPSQNKLHKLLYQVDELRSSGSKYKWIERGAEDIRPDTTPQLYQETLLESQDPSRIQDFYKSNMPNDILNDLSDSQLKELTSVGPNDKDLL